MLPSLPPCFTPRGADRPTRHTPPARPVWTPGRVSLHPDFPQARHARDGRVRLRLEQVEPAEPDLSPPLPLHELAGALVAHFNECLIDPGRVGILAKLPVLELQTALPQLHEVTRHWVSWCNRARINAGGAAAQADKILRLMASLVEVVADQGDALPGFASRIGEVQALAQAVRDHQTLVRDMPGYIASVWPSDGSWDRRPPTVAEVLLLMKTPGQDPTLVKARLADGQRPVDIAGQPSSVGLHEMEELCRQLAEQLQRADLALPLAEQQILLAPPPVPMASIARGVHCGLDAAQIRAMFLAGVPICPDTAPDAALRRRLACLQPMAPQRLGQGQVNRLQLRSWTDGSRVETWAWRPEVAGAFANAMIDCGIPCRTGQDLHRPGPNLTGRQVLTSRLAARLGLDRHITVVASHPAVVDGVYGSLNQYLPGLQMLVAAGPRPVPLADAERHWLEQHPDAPRLLADVARWQGLSGLSLHPQGLLAHATVPQSGGSVVELPMMRPLPVGSPRLRHQMVAAVWLHLLTAQVDWHAGNVAFVQDPHNPGSERLVLFDNDLAFGHCMLHPEDACNNHRHRPSGPRVQAPFSPLHGSRFPRVIPAELAGALLELDTAGLLACGAAGCLNRLEYEALRSRLHHIQREVRQLQSDPHGVLQTDADWASPETTARMGLDRLQEQADAVASAVLVPPGQQVDTTLLRELESDSLLRALAVHQQVARQHPQQQWFPVLFDAPAIQRALRTAMQQDHSPAPTTPERTST